MTEAYVELSGEAPELARAETASAVEALGGTVGVSDLEPLVAVEVPDVPTVARLAARLALARRCLVAIRPNEPLSAGIRSEGAAGAPAVFRRLGHPSAGAEVGVRDAGREYCAGGGTIDLERPARRYWLVGCASGADRLLLEIAAVDRAESAMRRMPLLPFQRPVSLPPRLARAAANLARIRPGDRIVDPFLGTGALLAEAALLGARVWGIDRDPEMVRGALRNFAHLGVSATQLVVGDSGSVDLDEAGAEYDAMLTDPPYGRASSTGGESPAEVVARVLPRWAGRVRVGGRLVVVVPTGVPELPEPWHLRRSMPVRVHRSLTREFRVYEREDP